MNLQKVSAFVSELLKTICLCLTYSLTRDSKNHNYYVFCIEGRTWHGLETYKDPRRRGRSNHTRIPKQNKENFPLVPTPSLFFVERKCHETLRDHMPTYYSPITGSSTTHRVYLSLDLSSREEVTGVGDGGRHLRLCWTTFLSCKFTSLGPRIECRESTGTSKVSLKTRGRRLYSLNPVY